MKKLLCALLLVLFCAVFAWAENEELTWEAPDVGPNITILGYAVQFWNEAKPEQKYWYITDGTRVPDITHVLNLTPGNTYAFVIVPYIAPNSPIGSSAPLVWQYGNGLDLENNLPIKIFIPGPSIISVEQQ